MSEPMTNRETVESFYEAVGEKAVVGEDGVKRGDKVLDEGKPGACDEGPPNEFGVYGREAC